MFAVSSQCVAIAQAVKAGTLTVTTKTDRFGDPVWLIGDDHGLIEVALSEAEASQRIAEIRERLAR